MCKLFTANSFFVRFVDYIEMAAISQVCISEILQKVTSLHNIHNWRFTQEKFETIAQNYFGIVVPVILIGEMNGEGIKLHLVLKLAPTDERYRVSGAVTAMFAREIFVYNLMLRSYQKLQENYPVHLQYKIPNCYYVQKDYLNEAIVMQNMLEEGYKPYTHAMFLEVDHIVVSLQSLAKLHALSFIMMDKNPDLYSKISRTCVPLSESSNKRYMDIMRDRLSKAIKVFEGTEYITLLKMLKDNCSKFFDAVVECVKKTCICHGDIWKENILYKYEDEKPVSACLIDYQSARISCAAFDALYLIISSTHTQLRKEYYNQLLDTYYQSFDKMLDQAGLKSQQIYSRQMLDNDLKIVAPACVITANCALWLSNGLQEEGHVRSKIVWNTLEEKTMAINRYKGIVEALVDDCCEYGYMTLDNNIDGGDNHTS